MMSPDYYKVNVITYLNPHQIWVSSGGNDNVLFEQIGVYGILPLDKTLGLEDSGINFVHVKCEDWKPAASAIMRGLLHECEEVWFCPTYLLSRTSIFDNNIHSYGEIKIKLKNGKIKKLSKELIKSGFAYGNVLEFHVKLRNCQIKSNLNKIQAQQILKELEYYCVSDKMLKCLEMQTFALHAYQKEELDITESCLMKHNEEIKKTLNDINIYLELCKGQDEVSVGRACRRNKPLPHNENPATETEGYKSDVSDNSHINTSVGNGNKSGTNMTNLKLSDVSQSETIVCSENNASIGNGNKENWLTRKLKLLSKIERKSDNILDKKMRVTDNESSEKIEKSFKDTKSDNIIDEKMRENDKEKIEKSLKDTNKMEKINSVNDFKIELRNIKNMNEINRDRNQIDQDTKSRDGFVVDPIDGLGLTDKINAMYQFHSKMSSIQEENVKLHKTSKGHTKSSGLEIDAKTKIAFGPPGMDPKHFKIQHITAQEREEYDQKMNIEKPTLLIKDKEKYDQKINIEKAILRIKDSLYDDVDSEVGIGSKCSKKVIMADENTENFLTRKLKLLKSLENAKRLEFV